MCKKKPEYIELDDFVNISGVKETTIKKNYKRIPGFQKTEIGFRILSGTRYPFNLRNTNLDDSISKRYTLLKAISKYQYISHKELRVEQKQFEDMLRDLLSAELIRPNNLSNTYGANAYDCTVKGDKLLKQKESNAKNEFINTIATATGNFTGAILSQIFAA